MSVVFLDRDGVINRFPGKGLYVTRWEDFHFLPRAIEAVRLLNRAGLEPMVVSNQGCVSRGLITMAGLEELTARMLKEVEAGGGKISGVFYCVHQTSDRCDCKKPKTKLFRDALKGRDVDPKTVFFIGDSEEDMEAGINFGCRTILVLSGRATREQAEIFQARPGVVKNDLWEAANWITQKKS